MHKSVNIVDLVKSFHVPFSQFLFERDSYSNEYLLAKIGVDTAENEPPKVCQKVAKSEYTSYLVDIARKNIVNYLSV